MRLSALLRARRRRRPRALRPHRSPATPDRVLPPPSPSVRFSILADHQRRARGPLFARALAAASWHRAARRDSFVVIPLSLPVAAEMAAPYVTRLRSHGAIDDPPDAALLVPEAAGGNFAGTRGLAATARLEPSQRRTNGPPRGGG